MGAIAASVLSGLLYGLLFPPVGAAWLSWIALAPLALALQRSRSFASGAALAAVSTWVGTASVIPWVASTLHEHFELGLGFSTAFWLLFSGTALAPYYAVLLGAQAWAARRLPRALAPILFAAAWTGAEWVRAQLGFRSPWTRLGDAQVDAVVLRQIADLAGVYGLSFLVALANGVAAAGLDVALARLRGRRESLRPPLLAAAGFAVLLALALVYGTLRLEALPRESSDFDVALVQGNLETKLRWRRAQAGRVLRRYGGLTRDVVVGSGPGGEPDLVVWPENAIQTAVDDPAYGPPLLRLAGRSPLLIGAPRNESENGSRRAFNSVFLISSEGVVDHYDKRRVLAFSETRPFGGIGSFGARGDLDVSEYTAGDRLVLFDVANERIAPLICMEALYPELARDAVLRGATVLANLSNDGWFKGRGGTQQHLAMVRFRAVETRRPVIRATTTGVSAVIAPDGSVAASLDEGARGVLRVEAPVGLDGTTLYTQFGDVFAVTCVGVTAVAALAGWRRRDRQARIVAGPSMPPRTSA